MDDSDSSDLSQSQLSQTSAMLSNPFKYDANAAAPPVVMPSGVHEGSGSLSQDHDHDQPSHLGVDDTVETKTERRKQTKPPKVQRTQARRVNKKPPAKKPPPKTTPAPLVTAEEETAPSLDSEEGEAATTTVEETTTTTTRRRTTKKSSVVKSKRRRNQVSTRGRPSPLPPPATRKRPRNGPTRPAAKGAEPAEEEVPEEPQEEQPKEEQPKEEQPKEEQPKEELQPAEEQPAADQPSAEQPALKQPAAEEPAAEEQPAEVERRRTPRTVAATTPRPDVPETRTMPPRTHFKTEKKQSPTLPPTTSKTLASGGTSRQIRALPPSSCREMKALKSRNVSHPLLCTVSSLAVEELRYPHEYCTHVIYTHAEFDFAKKSFVAPMASLSFTSFLNSKSKWANNTEGPRYLVSLSPAFVAQHAPEMSTGRTAARDMAAWLESTDLAGIALVEHVMTPDNVDLYVKFSSVRSLARVG
ncbi:hypothetical protein MTO96_043643 [Rhipicephalus appendiculatus]